jgi:branched-chain amino acid transport system substrate-binding protein
MVKRVVLVVAIVVPMLLMLILQLAYGQKEAPKTIKIGAMYEKTGPLSTNGQRFEWGLTKAVEKINMAGGIFIKEYNKKIPVELVIGDHQSKEDKAVTVAEYLNEKGIVALLGTTSILPTAASVYEKNHLPTLATFSGMDAPFLMGYKYIFSNSPKFSDLGKSAAAFFKNMPKKPSKVALFEAQADPGVETCRYAEQELKAVGIETVRVKFSWLTKDMSSAILEAMKAGADAVYSMAILPDAMLMIKQMKELNFNPKAILIIEGPTNRGPWKTLGKDGDFICTFNDFHWNLKYPEVNEITRMYEAEKKEKPYATTGAAWAAFQIVVDSIMRAGSLDREKIRDAMAKTDMMTVMGPIKFKQNGAGEIHFVPIVQYQNKVEVLVFPNNVKEKNFIPIPAWDKRQDW